MKKIFLIATTMVMMMGLCACGTEPVENAETQDVVNVFMTAVKEQDAETLKTIYSGDIELPEVVYGEEYKECSESLYEKILSFDYKITEEKVADESATVKVEIQTYPFMDMMIRWMEDVSLDPTIFEGMTDEEAMLKQAEMFLNRVNELDSKSYTEVATLEFVKDGDAWVIEDSECVDEFVKVIYAGVIQE